MLPPSSMFFGSGLLAKEIFLSSFFCGSSLAAMGLLTSVLAALRGDWTELGLKMGPFLKEGISLDCCGCCCWEGWLKDWLRVMSGFSNGFFFSRIPCCCEFWLSSPFRYGSLARSYTVGRLLSLTSSKELMSCLSKGCMPFLNLLSGRGFTTVLLSSISVWQWQKGVSPCSN